MFNVMKKNVLSFLAMSLVFGACTKEMNLNQNQTKTAADLQAELIDRTKGAVTLMSAPAPAAPAVERKDFNWQYPVDIFKIFPEFITPEGYYDNFLYVSDGNPFDLVFLYCNGGYRHEMGIYWYDGDVCHEQSLWLEQDDEDQHYWINFNGTDSQGEISRKSDKAGAYTIQFPAGTKYGFYCHSTLYGEEVIRKYPTPMPAGPEVEYNYKFYTEQGKNWTYPIAQYYNFAEQGKKMTQAMTTSLNGWTIVGFEDVAIIWPSCDFDYNDCVFAMNPVQKIDGEPDPERVEGSVETNLSVADKGSYDQVKLSIHVRANTDVKLVLPIKDSKLLDNSDYYAILAKHDVEVKYDEPITVAGQEIKFKYSFAADGALIVETEGINQTVLDYCNNTYVDGMTFELNLGYGRFNMEGEPVISFTKDPYMYVTSCVNDSPEAKDYEVKWNADGVNLIFSDPSFGPKQGLTYTHNFYSPFTLEELKTIGFLKEK